MSKRCTTCKETCGDATAWPTSHVCNCRCHEYSYEEYEPRAMMPANGARAVYVEPDGSVFTHPLAMWVICVVTSVTRHPNRGVTDRTKDRRIVGMQAGEYVESVEATRGFVGYARPEDTDEELQELYGRRPAASPRDDAPCADASAKASAEPGAA
jgi:hypothetical protein